MLEFYFLNKTYPVINFLANQTNQLNCPIKLQKEEGNCGQTFHLILFILSGLIQRFFKIIHRVSQLDTTEGEGGTKIKNGIKIVLYILYSVLNVKQCFRFGIRREHKCNLYLCGTKVPA